MKSPFTAFTWAKVFVPTLIFAHIGFAASVGTTTDTPASYTRIDVILLISYVLFALIFSFLCSVAEAVLLSITPSFIAGIKEEKPKLADLLKRLKQDDVDQSLAAILTLNTIAHTVGAIGSGAKATVVFGSAWFGLFSAIMTLMILFLSEIIPKTIGAVHWRKLAGVTAIFIRGLIVILYPLIWVSERLTKLISHGKSLHSFSRDEFIAMAGVGEQAGHLNEHESRILGNLFRFDSLKAKDIMTPRTVIAAVPQDMTINEALDTNPHTPFSRLPIYKSNLDDITGFVIKDDMLLYKAQGKGDIRIETLKRDMDNIPSETSLSGLLEFLLNHRKHIAIVVGEYGDTRGLVTLEDVVETLLGMEIVDETDRIEDMQVLARQQWKKRAQALGIETEEG